MNEKQMIQSAGFLFDQCVESAKQMKERPDILAVYIWQAYVSALAVVDPTVPDEAKVSILKEHAFRFLRSLLAIRNVPFVDAMDNDQVLAKVKEMFDEANSGGGNVNSSLEM